MLHGFPINQHSEEKMNTISAGRSRGAGLTFGTMKRSIRHGWLGLAVCTLLSGAAFGAAFGAVPDEVRSTLHGQHGVTVTIYNSDLALVKDQRKIKLRSGL